jgi:glycerol-3-phosphate dehydrogenase
MHEHLTASESIDRMPILRSGGLRGSYVYSDGYMDDDRLVHETLRSADAKGAAIANFVEATGAVYGADGKITEVVCRDGLSNKELRIRARHVISTVGPWTDELGGRWFGDWKKILRPTKGVHLTFRRDRLPLSSAVVMAAEKSNRIVFAIPRHEMIVVGTTDTDFSGSPQDVRTDRADVDYLLAIANQYFPGARLREADILASYAGVRPLVNDGSASEGKTSREHTIFTDPRGVTFVAGGKYTTYRLMAEQVIDEALEGFSLEERMRYAQADTSKPLNPDTDPEIYRRAQFQVDDMARDFQRSPGDVRLLCERYGAEAERILARYSSEWSYWQLEAAQAIETTMCLNLTDFYLRRVPLYLATPGHGLDFAEGVGRVFQHLLRWDDATLAEQLRALKAAIARETAWRS